MLIIAYVSADAHGHHDINSEHADTNDSDKHFEKRDAPFLVSAREQHHEGHRPYG